MTASSFPPPPKVRESRFDDWMFRFYKGVDIGGAGSKWTASGSDIYRPSGKVGIGTASPAVNFHVSGTGNSISRTESTDNTTSSFASFQTTTGASLGYLLNHAAARTVTRYGVTLGGYVEVYVADASGTNNGLIIGTQGAKPIIFGTSNVEAARLKSTRELVCNPSYVNVRQYGALGDGSTDDTTAIGNALTDAAANGMRRVYFPQGTYRITSALTISGDWHLFGDGPSISIIKVDGAINGIVHTGDLDTRDNGKLEILHLGFRSNNSGALSAIKGTWTTTGSGLIAAVPSCLISDVEIGASSSTTAFTKGIELYEANHGQIEKVAIYGIESGTSVAGSCGIYLSGGGASGAWVTATAYVVGDRVVGDGAYQYQVFKCLTAHTSGTFSTDLAAGKWVATNVTDFKINDCTIHYCETGIYALDSEGVHYHQNTILSCLDGIKVETTTTAGKPYHDIRGNHMNVGRYGIHLIEAVQSVISNNLIYGDQNTPLSGTTFMGVRIESGSLISGVNVQSIVADNLVLMVAETGGGYSTANYGYAVYGGSGTIESIIFKGNKSQACDVLIYLDSSTTGVVILDDNIGTSGETWSNNGTGNSLPYGVYTPTGYGITNCTDGDLTEYEAMWTRTGDEVTVYGDIDIDPTAANTLTTFRLSLPPDCITDQSAATKLSGVLSSPSGANGPGGTFQMHTATSPDRAECSYYATSASASRHSYCYRFRVV